MDRSSQRPLAPRQASTWLVLLMVSCGEGPGFFPGGLALSFEGERQGKVDLPMEVKVRAIDGVAPYLWTRNGSVPGFHLDDDGGREAVFRGTPQIPGMFFVSVNAEDSQGSIGSVSFPIDIAAHLPPPRFETEQLPLAVAGNYYSASIALIGGQEPIQWTVGELPSGLQFEESARAITGRPMFTGSYVIHVRVVDIEDRSVDASFSLEVVSKLVIETLSLPTARAGMPYRAVLSASGGVLPYVWSGMQLPDGFSLSGDAIEGTAAEPGQFLFSVEVTDESGQVAVQYLMLDVGS